MIRIDLPYIPPSVNEAYVNVHGSGRTLSATGRQFKNTTRMLLAQMYHNELRIFQRDKPMGLLIILHLERLENVGKGKVVKRKGVVKEQPISRYKNIDVTNRVKLLEDCLKDTTGIDDAQNITVIAHKKQSTTGKDHTTVYAWSIEEEGSPFESIIEQVSRG